MENPGHHSAPVDLSRSAPPGASAPSLNPCPSPNLSPVFNPSLVSALGQGLNQGLSGPASPNPPLNLGPSLHPSSTLHPSSNLLPPALYGRGLDAYGGLGGGGGNGGVGSEASECRLVEYRGERVAAFVQRGGGGELLLCLPQAFELFLKHLVGGLHTVYTKLKRLGISPIVCNVEQVRVLRGLGAIQPGVNRCKLLACRDFDALYRDCTTASSRPGRPPKRSGLMLALANSNVQSGSVAAAAQSFQAAKKLRTDGDLSAVFANGEVYDESVDKTTLLLNCLRQQMTDSAGRAQTQAQTPLANGRPESAGRNDVAAMSPPERRPTPLSTHRSMAPPELAMDDSCYMSLEQNTCDVKHSGSDIRASYAYEAAAAPLVAVDQGTVSDGSARGASMEDSPDEGDSSKGSCCREDLVGAVLGAGLSSDVGSLHEAALVRAYDVYSMEALLRNIQTLLRVAADGARHHERQMSLEKAELGMEILREREMREKIEKQLVEEQKFRVLYQRRLRRERRSRRKVQEQLQDEVKRRLKFEETLRENSAEAVRFLSDALDTKDGAETQFRLDAEQKMHDCAMSLYAPEAPRCGSPGR